MRFEISYHGGTTHEVELPGSVCVVGRDPGCDIVLNDSKCSRRHAVIEDGPAGLSIRDAGSANGDLRQRHARSRGRRSSPGDSVQLGEVLLRLLPEIGETVVVAPEGLEFETGRPRPQRARRLAASAGAGGSAAPDRRRHQPDPRSRRRRRARLPRPCRARVRRVPQALRGDPRR